MRKRLSYSIIDSQVHIWGEQAQQLPHPPTFRRPKPPDQPVTPFDKDKLLGEMDAAGVDRAILVPPRVEPGPSENHVVLEAAMLHPDRFAIMGRIALDKENSRARLAAWKKQPGMLGVRLPIHSPTVEAGLHDGTLDWFWRDAEREDIPVMMFPSTLLPEIASVAARHPGLRIILDHLAVPTGVKDNDVGQYIDRLLPLARYRNVAVKASAVPRLVSEPYPFRSLHGHIQRVVEAFGPNRVFWGSDLTTIATKYSEVVDLFTQELDFLSELDKSWIMGRGLAAWLDWPLDEASRELDHAA